MAKELLKRNQVKEENTWNLKDLFETREDWEKCLSEIEELSEKIAAMEGKVGESAANLLYVLSNDTVSDKKLERAFSYATRLYDQDQTNAEHQGMYQKVVALSAEVSRKTAFIQPEILAISDETLENFYREEKELELYRKWIVEVNRLREHRLSTEMETLMAMTSRIKGVPSSTFSVLNNADLKFPEMTDENGETVRITNGRYIGLVESADRRVRKEAFEKLYSVYEQFARTLASLYDGQVKSQIFSATARKYASTLEAAVTANNVPSKVYYNLIDTIEKNMDKLHRYVRLRKKCLGLEEMHMYDIYTPMIAEAARKMPFEEAKETVLKALSPLGEEYIAKVREGFENRWIDVYENEGKRSGAYSSGVYGVHPYVMLNYNDTLDNMFTLAHEMGHAMHSYYSSTTQPYPYSHYKIFVAEVASTCNEILLMEYLLKNTTDPKERAYLYNHYLDSFKGTVYRQTMFAEFEMKTNRMVEEGVSLTSDNLCKLYKELNEKYYGPDVISDREISFEWARIPHFYYNFYVYQYATGFSAAVTLARGILKEGQPAVDRYKKFLKGGCSETPIELLRIAGVDMESTAPIQSALDVFEEIIEELEKLI